MSDKFLSSDDSALAILSKQEATSSQKGIQDQRNVTQGNVLNLAYTAMNSILVVRIRVVNSFELSEDRDQ